MSAVASAVEELRTLATQTELELIGLLFSDSCVSTAVRDCDRVMLAKVLGVSVMSFEDGVKDNYGVVFRNYPGNFEIVQNKSVILKTKDDIIGSVGCSIVQRAMKTAGTSLMSYYLSGKRSRETIQEIAKSIDREGVELALPQIRASFPATTKTANFLGKQAEHVKQLPLPDDCEEEQKNIWCEYLSALTTFYTQLRTNPGPIVVVDRRVKGEPVTVGRAIRERLEMDKISFVAKDGSFSAAETGMMEMLDLSGREVVEVDGVEHFICTTADVFEYVSSSYIEPAEIPDWTKPVEQLPVAPATPARSIASPVANPCDGEAESIIRDYYGVNLNTCRDISKQLIVGGLSDAAKELWASLSKAKQGQFLRALDEQVPFRRGVELVAASLDLEVSEALAEVLASKLVMARSAFKIDKAAMTVERV